MDKNMKYREKGCFVWITKGYTRKENKLTTTLHCTKCIKFSVSLVSGIAGALGFAADQ